VDECKPLPLICSRRERSRWCSPRAASLFVTGNQGLTLVHVSAQRKRFVWDRGAFRGEFRGCLGGVRGFEGCRGCVLCQKRLRLS